MFWADFRIKVIDFFRKYSKIVFVILLVWTIILVVNNLLKGVKKEDELEITYKPHVSVLNSAEKVPEKLEEPVNNLIDTYFNYCQNKQYELAYDMLLDGCKEQYFRRLSDFKDYIDSIFDEEKTYYIQNYSNYKGVYIYQMRIFQNIMKTGLTGVDDISFYEEKISVQNVDGELKLGIRQYISTDIMDDIYEDDYLKIWIEKKDTFYEAERYTIKIRNKSEYIAVLYDETEQTELILYVGSNMRETINSNLDIIIQPGETNEYVIDFTKFYDESYISNGLVFNNVRILKSYTGLEASRDYELKNAEKLYSIEIPF